MSVGQISDSDGLSDDGGPVSGQSFHVVMLTVGHGSTIEHVNFTFAISGVTRTLSHQLVGHRAGTAFDQQSQRYVSFKKRDNFTIPDSITKGDLPDDLAGRFQRAIDDNLDLDGQLLQAEVPAEDARFIFPNAMQTNLIMTVNLPQLIHMSGLRLCTMAQWEIRQLFKQIRHEIFRAIAPHRCGSDGIGRMTIAVSQARLKHAREEGVVHRCHTLCGYVSWITA